MLPDESRREARGAARRDQILQAAIVCFSRKGYHLTTMDDIVAESGMSKGSLYWHYENKKDILISAAEWYFGQMVGEMRAAAPQSAGAQAKIELLLSVFADLLNADDGLINVFIDFYAETRHDAEVTAALQEMMLPLIDAIAAIVAEGSASGEFKAVDARSVALLFMAAGDGLVLYKQIFDDRFDWNAAAGFFAESFLAGLQAGPSQEPSP